MKTPHQNTSNGDRASRTRIFGLWDTDDAPGEKGRRVGPHRNRRPQIQVKELEELNEHVRAGSSKTTKLSGRPAIPTGTAVAMQDTIQEGLKGNNDRSIVGAQGRRRKSCRVDLSPSSGGSWVRVFPNSSPFGGHPSRVEVGVKAVSRAQLGGDRLSGPL